jgi:hypothetical protein
MKKKNPSGGGSAPRRSPINLMLRRCGGWLRVRREPQP